MLQPMHRAEEETARKEEAIRYFSFGFLAAAVAAEAVFIILALFGLGLPLLVLTCLAAATILVSLLTYLTNRSGRAVPAGYFLVISLIVIFTVAIYLFGGSAGPLVIILALPVLVAAIIISIRSTFLVATVSSVLLLSSSWVEANHLLPQVIMGGWEAAVQDSSRGVLVYIGISVRIISFYIIAFLSWFAASRLNRALQSVRRYASELQEANEKLRASEEELRVSNEELEASNEELRATEEELRASNEELETTNTDLKQAQEQLVRTEKLAAIGQLAGGVGHELRNPLGAIKNAVYYIKGKIAKSDLAKQEPRVMEFLGIVDDEIDSSNKIINDLLSFSRVGKPAASPVRVEKVIEDALAHTDIPENVVLEKKVAPGLPEVAMDRDQIRQVLVNILTNAVQAMPEGGRISLNVDENDGFLEMKVKDSGTGIPQEIISRVFDPLFTTRAKGIGLGLAVCKSIIERHGGQILVESNNGQGTVFTIRLPMTAQENVTTGGGNR